MKTVEVSAKVDFEKAVMHQCLARLLEFWYIINTETEDECLLNGACSETITHID